MQFYDCEEMVKREGKRLTLLELRTRSNYYVLMDSYPPQNEISSDSIDPEISSLLSMVDWNTEYLKFGYLNDETLQPTIDFAKKKGFVVQKLFTHYEYSMKFEDLKFEENDKELDSLDISEAEYIHKRTPYFNIDVDYYRTCLKRLPSSCIRDVETKKPIAWEICYPDIISLGFLHVEKDYRRKGFATRVQLDLMRKIKKMFEGKMEHILVHVNVGNKASINFQEKLGFKRLDGKVYWVSLRREEQ